jgi:hypothetical protein
MAMRRKCRQLLFELGGMTLGTVGFLVSEDDGFKLVATLCAKIFEDRHIHSGRPPASALGGDLP